MGGEYSAHFNLNGLISKVNRTYRKIVTSRKSRHPRAMPAGRQESGGPLEWSKNLDSRLRGNDDKGLD